MCVARAGGDHRTETSAHWGQSAQNKVISPTPLNEFRHLIMVMPNTPLTGLRPPGPLVLDVNISNNWKVWYCAYSFYTTAAGIEQRAEHVQCSVFLHMAGTQAQ